jgi:hypothetical protein
MHARALFSGLIVDEYDHAVETAQVGGEAMYVIDDQGFRRHIPAVQVDRAVLEEMKSSIEGHEDQLTEQAAKMMGQDDPFSRAMLEQQIKNMGDHFDQVLQMGIPEEARAYMGMAGFKVRINFHGELLEIVQPGAVAPED